MNLTNRQKQIVSLTAVGLSAKEIADKIGSTTSTVNTHLRDIKTRLGLQKITEITAFYWLNFFGKSLEDERKRVLSTIFILLVIIQIFTGSNDFVRRNVRSRSKRIETIES
ncbi:MAG: helix-turn-helix transcriptional regulator [Dysgonamonadaceae bacterium]